MSELRISSLAGSETDSAGGASGLGSSSPEGGPAGGLVGSPERSPVGSPERVPQQLEDFTKRLSLLGLQLKPTENGLDTPTTPTQPSTTAASKKVMIRFQPIGSIPAVKPALCNVSTDNAFSTVVLFLQRKLGRQFVFCYINNSFAPTPDQNVGDLWNQFHTNNELIVNYCAIVAFG